MFSRSFDRLYRSGAIPCHGASLTEGPRYAEAMSAAASPEQCGRRSISPSTAAWTRSLSTSRAPRLEREDAVGSRRSARTLRVVFRAQRGWRRRLRAITDFGQGPLSAPTQTAWRVP
jgi:hypothetical protein